MSTKKGTQRSAARYAGFRGNSSAPVASRSVPEGSAPQNASGEPGEQGKMSEVLQQFLAPLLEQEPGATLAQLRSAYKLGALVWNIAVATRTMEAFDAAFARALASFSEESEEREALVTQARSLASRKWMLFPEEQHLVLDFDLRYVGKTLRLTVGSAPLAAPPADPAG